MFKPAIQKTRVLVILAIVNLLLFLWASNSTGKIETPGHEYKKQAANRMKSAMTVLKETRYGQNPVFLDAINDPNETGLVGPKFSHISTGEGDLDSKLSTLNPNFAALIVEIFLEADLSKGDKVAVSFTGSMPGANLAVMSACQVMEITPYIVSSVGSSHWGATDPDFTWIDMEKILVSQDELTHQSIAVSYGGKSDAGGGMSPFGREQIDNAFERSGISKFIESERLSESVQTRIDLYKESAHLNEYSVYINVGGGAASVGALDQARDIPPGFSLPSDLKSIKGGSVIMQFASLGIPIVHILNIRELCEKYGVKFAPVPFPPIGKGKLFEVYAYNITVTLTALCIALGSLVGVAIHSHNQIAHQRDSYEPESIL